MEDAKAKFKEVAARIRELREACGYSQQELAEYLQVDLSVYVGYEENGYDIPISVIYSIATKFGVDFNEILTGINAKLNTYHVVKRGQGLEVDRYPGYSFEDLAFRFTHKIMQPLLVTLQPDEEKPEMVTHLGQEFNLVLEGSVKVFFEDKEITLNEGDAIYFNPQHPHGQQCASKTKARFLTVIAE